MKQLNIKKWRLSINKCSWGDGKGDGFYIGAKNLFFNLKVKKYYRIFDSNNCSQYKLSHLMIGYLIKHNSYYIYIDTHIYIYI